MTRQLVPLKIKISFDDENHAIYPKWSKLSIINTDVEMKYHCPTKIFHDNSCKYQNESINNSKKIQWGCLLCTQDFADEAVLFFPEMVSQITKKEFIDFFDNKVNEHLAENIYDINVLQGLKLELELKKELKQDVAKLKAKIAKAINPQHESAGIKENKDKRWNTYKNKIGIAIK